MNILYNTGIRLYSAVARLLGMAGHRKASLMTRGQRSTMETLRRFDAESPQGAERVWIHAASLGEFEQGRPLIEWLRRERPSTRILLSFFSPSGYEVRKGYRGTDAVVYLPFDTPAAAHAFVAAARPSIAIFVKYEFWGNYLEALRKAGAKTYLISAIFRHGQVFFRPYGGMFRKMLSSFSHIFVQDEASASRLRGIGLDQGRVSVAGDTRFDRVTDTLRAAHSLPEVEAWLDASGGRDRFTAIFGSSWGPDEEIYFPWLASHPEARSIVAPHEFDDTRLKTLISKLGGPDEAILHSELASASPERLTRARHLIVDCFGLLASIYRYGHMAYVGGGFGVGIHSITEAAVYSIPVIFGPCHDKFREARDLIACGGAFTIDSPRAFATIASRMLQDPAARSAAGSEAGEYIASNVGATAIIATAIFPDK
ncbi:MAG: hypothetical protein NC342_00200 [Pseudoflavonifractor sp.]|nr:3-deoxy-D-manno-octulosonic acid transferase [Alloprevotella sp.]MCM1115948.1 hypothetical protein [Pseudoflavonifractor sp.]